jgi:hypothetical protein
LPAAWSPYEPLVPGAAASRRGCSSEHSDTLLSGPTAARLPRMPRGPRLEAPPQNRRTSPPERGGQASRDGAGDPAAVAGGDAVTPVRLDDARHPPRAARRPCRGGVREARSLPLLPGRRFPRDGGGPLRVRFRRRRP